MDSMDVFEWKMFSSLTKKHMHCLPSFENGILVGKVLKSKSLNAIYLLLLIFQITYVSTNLMLKLPVIVFFCGPFDEYFEFHFLVNVLFMREKSNISLVIESMWSIFKLKWHFSKLSKMSLIRTSSVDPLVVVISQTTSFNLSIDMDKGRQGWRFKNEDESLISSVPLSSLILKLKF